MHLEIRIKGCNCSRMGANNDAKKEENEKGKRKSEKEWIGLQRVNRLSTWREIQRCQTDDTRRDEVWENRERSKKEQSEPLSKVLVIIKDNLMEYATI